MMEKEQEIKKNLCDLEYSKYLNYLGILLIILTSIVITSWFSSISFLFKVIITVSVSPSALLVWF